MVRVGLNGFGRIGRAVFRVNAETPRFEIVGVNDLNPDSANLAYLLKYDSTYGRFDRRVALEGDALSVDGKPVQLFHRAKIEDVPWEELGVDLVLEATGARGNILAAPKLIGRGIRKVVITNSPEQVDLTLILGANEAKYQPAKHHVISSSICDAVATAPVLKLIDDAYGIESGFITTLHPWLAYQNLMDGSLSAWFDSEMPEAHYAVGRTSPGALIPKPTTAVQAVEKVLPEMKGRLQCMSYRTPTEIVGAANLYLRLKKPATVAAANSLFAEAERSQRWPVIHVNDEPLVSVDFIKAPYSAIVDRRWTATPGSQELHLVLWYDNEWGYSNRVLDVSVHVLGVNGAKGR